MIMTSSLSIERSNIIGLQVVLMCLTIIHEDNIQSVIQQSLTTHYTSQDSFYREETDDDGDGSHFQWLLTPQGQLCPNTGCSAVEHQERHICLYKCTKDTVIYRDNNMVQGSVMDDDGEGTLKCFSLHIRASYRPRWVCSAVEHPECSHSVKCTETLVIEYYHCRLQHTSAWPTYIYGHRSCYVCVIYSA